MIIPIPLRGLCSGGGGGELRRYSAGRPPEGFLPDLDALYERSCLAAQVCSSSPRLPTRRARLRPRLSRTRVALARAVRFLVFRDEAIEILQTTPRARGMIEAAGAPDLRRGRVPVAVQGARTCPPRPEASALPGRPTIPRALLGARTSRAPQGRCRAARGHWRAYGDGRIVRDKSPALRAKIRFSPTDHRRPLRLRRPAGEVILWI